MAAKLFPGQAHGWKDGLRVCSDHDNPRLSVVYVTYMLSLNGFSESILPLTRPSGMKPLGPIARSAPALALATSLSTLGQVVDQPFSLSIDPYLTPRTTQFDRFDPTLGELDKITIEFSPVVASTLLAYSTDDDFNGWSFSLQGTVSFSSHGLATHAPFYFADSGLTRHYGELVTRQLGPSVLTAPAAEMTSALAPFIGSGTISASISASFVPEFYWSRSGTSGFSNRIGASGTIHYHYTPIPEPGGAPFFVAAALLSLTLARRALPGRITL